MSRFSTGDFARSVFRRLTLSPSALRQSRSALSSGAIFRASWERSWKQDWTSPDMSENAAPTRDPSLDVASVVASEFPERAIERLVGARQPRFQAIIKQCVLDDIHAHGKSSPEAEICGVVV